MAVKSILDIEVNDGRFREFARLYEKYQTALKSAPAAWKLVEKNIDGSRASFGKLVDQMASANVQAKLREKAQERADQLTRSSADRWQSMARNTREFAKNIGDATLSLLKWGSITGVISGLVGAGGLFGIDRLAMGVAGNRRSALGRGTGYGEQQAFSANFGRLVDPEAFLSGVAGAKFDVTKRVGLMGAGLSEKEIGGDTADTAVALLRNLKRIADTTSPALYAQVLQARRLDQFASSEDLNRLRNTSPAEIARLEQQYGRDRSKLDVGSDTAERWQDFVTQMSNAGKSIETTFVKGLAPLAPGLTKLSDSVSKVIESFLGSPALGRWIGEVDKGLEKFAGYIGTDEFSQKVSDFVDDVGKLASAIGTAVSWIVGKLPADAKTGGLLGEKEGHDTWNSMVRGSRELRQQRASGNATLMGQLAGAFGPDQLLNIVRRSEASGDAAVSPAGAVGRYQIMPGTARQYGGDPSRLTDPAYNEQLAKKILADLARRYHGNTDEILAAYNGGPRRGDQFRDSNHNLGVLPAETQRYVTRARGMDGYAPATVVIENSTGGNATVSVNGLKD